MGKLKALNDLDVFMDVELYWCVAYPIAIRVINIAMK